MEAFPRLCFELHQFKPIILASGRGYFAYGFPREVSSEVLPYLRERESALRRGNIRVEIMQEGEELQVIGYESQGRARL